MRFGQGQLPGIAADELLLVPEPDSNAGFTVEAEALNKGLTQVTFAASTDESHPVLTGVLAGAPGQTMTLAAADGFRLSLREIPWLMLCQRRSV